MTDTQQGNDQQEAPKPLNVAALIGLYVQLRDTKRNLEQQLEDQVKPYTDRLQKIEAALAKYMNEHNLNSLPTDLGTAYISVRSSASIADGAAFRNYVIESRAWDLADWRANAPACEAFISEHQTPVPGVNFRQTETVGVRRPTAK